MTEELIIAGFGGQGVMSMGQLLTYAGMLENKAVSWMPSYGPEMRGGTANCTVVISDEEEIGSPVITEPTTAIVMNLPSLEKFEGAVRSGGLLLYNSSLINKEPTRKDIEVYGIPGNDVADKLGNPRIANMVVLGAFIKKTGIVSLDSLLDSLKKVLPERRHNLIPLNEKALREGGKYIK